MISDNLSQRAKYGMAKIRRHRPELVGVIQGRQPMSCRQLRAVAIVRNGPSAALGPEDHKQKAERKETVIWSLHS